MAGYARGREGGRRGLDDGRDFAEEIGFEAAEFAEAVGEGEGAGFAATAVDAGEVVGAVVEREELLTQGGKKGADGRLFVGEVEDDAPGGAFGQAEKFAEYGDEEPAVEQAGGGGEGGPEVAEEFAVEADVAGLVGGVQAMELNKVGLVEIGPGEGLAGGGDGALLDDHGEPEAEGVAPGAAGAVAEETERGGGELDEVVVVVAVEGGFTGAVEDVEPGGVALLVAAEFVEAPGEGAAGVARHERGQGVVGEHAFEEDEVLVVAARKKLVVAELNAGR